MTREFYKKLGAIEPARHVICLLKQIWLVNFFLSYDENLKISPKTFYARRDIWCYPYIRDREFV